MIRVLAGAAALICLSLPAHAQSTLRMIDTGAEPRAPLRYTFTVGQTERAVTEMVMSSSTEMNGKTDAGPSMPPVRSAMSMRVTEVAPDGTARLEFKTDSAEAAAGHSGPTPNQAQLNSTLAGLSQLAGWYRIDTRGRVLQSGVSLPESLSSGPAAQMMEDMLNEQDTTLQQFPEEAVGQGARWEVVQTSAIGPIRMVMTQEYTLRSRSGNRVELDVSGTQTLDLPADVQPAGASVSSGGNSSTGKMSVDLDRLVPHGDMVASSTTTMSRPVAGGEAQVTKMQSQMRMTTGPATE